MEREGDAGLMNGAVMMMMMMMMMIVGAGRKTAGNIDDAGKRDDLVDVGNGKRFGEADAGRGTRRRHRRGVDRLDVGWNVYWIKMTYQCTVKVLARIRVGTRIEGVE